MRILIIEDEESLAKLIKDGLESEGFAADYVLDGEAGQSRVELCHNDYDLILLDLMLPKKNGLEICKFARENKIATPILMLTAKDGADDIINGLNVGADDYLVKPFSFKVLLARIRAILRRPKTALPIKLQVKNLVLDTTAKKFFKNDQEIKLTLKEFNLLEYLMRNPGRVLNREQILSNIWDFSFDSFSNVVDVHITNLRKKLGDKSGDIIKTVHGVGYQLNS
ncbi:MAG: response regulator transcription factor [bacterium]|nr:response regulator transcription factor [bacterium]